MELRRELKVRGGGIGQSQEDRRRAILERQRAERCRRIGVARLVAVSSSDATSDEMDAVCSVDGKPSRSRRRSRAPRLVAMQAEPLREIPDGLRSDYLAVPMPIGERCLVVCAKGHTVVRKADGTFLRRITTLFPNGSPRTMTSRPTQEVVILDCVFRESNNCVLFHILDLLCWKGYDILNCDAAFRFYWLQQKLSEIGGPVIRDESHLDCVFQPATVLPCCRLAIEQYLAATADAVESLFLYHKDGHYELGESPLVCFVSLSDVPALLVATDVAS